MYFILEFVENKKNHTKGGETISVTKGNCLFTFLLVFISLSAYIRVYT